LTCVRCRTLAQFRVIGNIPIQPDFCIISKPETNEQCAIYAA
jgi:hypothetical protein